MPQSRLPSLRSSLGSVDGSTGRFIRAADATVSLRDLVRGTSLGGRLPALRGRSVLVATRDQLPAALALIELDGVARRLTLCPPDLRAEHLAHVMAVADVDAVVTDAGAGEIETASTALRVICSPPIVPAGDLPPCDQQTEWILLTSGTTGVPKMVVHSLASLTGAIADRGGSRSSVVWATFYDIRRYGGLQIFFRGVLGGGSLVLSSAGEPAAQHLQRLGACGVTHLTGTPSHWRRAIMSPSAGAISPQYVRMSGEIADQATLDSLRAIYPRAGIAHAYASTEAGVAFDVDDGHEGFPSSLIGAPDGNVDMKVVDGSLRIRSHRTASRYLGGDTPALRDAEGFIDTGDIVEQRGGRCYFVGRRGGIINVGGLKVHPEEVEAVINRHPDVRMSLVRSRRNPITGAIVVADVVLRTPPDTASAAELSQHVKREILKACRDALPEHKVPAAISFVASLEVAATGKLVRQYA
ncbi:MAG: hypothetical protein QOI12_2308 [Alphaproteobacteria bacterium]|jgi:acyl-coenzyme A synthetase/AMP-(fatty) acid ligase|nr:hypothetical protein [Alphaproteobacteria bacterium]